MTERILRLFTDSVTAESRVALGAANRILYVVGGILEIDAGTTAMRLTPGSSAFLDGAANLRAAAEGAELLRWELVARPEPDDGLLKAAGATSRRTLDAPVAMDDATSWLMRLDTVELPASGKAPMHTHQGPGIRCLLEGGFGVDTQGHTNTFKPGEAWFETGPDPVVAWVEGEAAMKFARVMLLPRALLGKQSTRYVHDDPVVATRGRRWTIHLDRAITP